MSSYLVAFFVGKLESRTSQTSDGTRFEVWARPEVISQTKYALDTGPRILEFYNKLLGVKEPLPKQDIVALPKFVANALENWGLISFGLFCHSSGKSRRYYPTQWSIDLLLSWILYIRLNLLPYLCRKIPICVGYSVSSVILKTVTGYYLLRMLNHSLGEKTFLDGCRKYVLNNSLKTVDQHDLWNVLTEQAHLDQAIPRHLHLADMMNSWTTRAGYPVINIVRNYTTGNATLRQTESLWWIPVTYTTQSRPNFYSTKPKIWMTPHDYEKQLAGLPGEEEWVLLNIQATGLYRVNYDHKNWELLSNYLNSEKYEEIAVLNRALLLDDALNLARVGQLPYRPPVDFYVQQLVARQFKEFGFLPHKNSSYLNGLLHKEIVRWACQTGLHECIHTAQEFFNKWTKGSPITFPRSIRAIVYCAAVQYGGPTQWNALWKLFRNSTSSTERNTILLGLGCSQDENILKSYLDWAVQSSPSDCFMAFKAVASSDIGFAVAKDFLFNSIESSRAITTIGKLYLPEILEILTSRMNQPKHLQELEKLERKHKDKFQASSTSIKQMKERITYNIQWIENNYKDISNWLQSTIS
ncbi:hypothetical protein L9F63_001880 [Diploptera punctata]|uniref:Aminopeptidase N n=1 Tax=Diploptera punctata TaxID=6984 RepID=A0AAD8A3W7_DIPPU|nr:hypothetical protein L9F63_001880 [Diploptera punctata]